MSEETIVDPFPEELEWRKALHPALQSVAARHGKAKFLVAFNTGLCNENLNILANGARNNPMAQQLIGAVAAAFNMLAEYALTATELDYKSLRLIQIDIEQAGRLAGASRLQDNGKLIIPS